MTRCFDACGEPSTTPIPSPPRPPRQLKGQLLVVGLDSGLPRCRWHRVRIDADVPSGTKLLAQVATAEDLTNDQGQPDPGWSAFPPGPPHPDDWQDAAAGAVDFLVQQPPGRYLHLRLRFVGDGHATPAVRRVRIDLPRSTSLEHLPAAYRETPEAEDFTERFLSMFDATIEQLDRAITRAAALVDAQGVPDEVLPWLGAFLDLAFDSSWTPAERRALIARAPRLYRERGTPAGLAEIIELVTGVKPALVELGPDRAFSSLGAARVGSTRLFGRAAARFRAGRSKLCGAPLKSFGNPDQDPLAVDAFRFQVLVPKSAAATPEARERLRQLVDSQKPAHTVASLRVGGALIVGVRSAVGIDTVLGAIDPPVLGRAGNVRLGRASVLFGSRKGSPLGFPVGAAAVGIDTVMR